MIKSNDGFGDQLSIQFLDAIHEIENELLEFSFKKHSVQKHGGAYFVEFKKGQVLLEFQFGPPEFQIDIILFASKGKFEFKDLMEIPKIGTWVNNHIYSPPERRNLKMELLWFMDLIKFSLTHID